MALIRRISEVEAVVVGFQLQGVVPHEGGLRHQTEATMVPAVEGDRDTTHSWTWKIPTLVWDEEEAAL